MNPKRFKEYRKDGWPLCPKCGEDELVSALLQVVDSDPYDPSETRPTLQECLQHGFLCINCDWVED